MRWLAAGVAFAIGMTVGPASASESDLPSICANELNAAERFNVDVSRLDEGRVGLDGREMLLDGTAGSWSRLDKADPTFTVRFHSLAWLVPAFDQGIDVVSLVLQREAVLPDPGFTVGQDALRAVGWKASQVRLRMGTISCLYRASADARLIPVMEGLVAANMDPLRYRGRPFNRLHNHGTLSNIALGEAARVFERPEWGRAALARFAADSAAVFSSCGMSVEQSTSYHLLNVKLWTRSLDRISQEIPFTASMGDSVRDAELATWALTRPDGVLEAIGDGNEQVVTAADLGLDDTALAQSDTRLMCSGRGWAANRTSWDDTATHYTLRFGDRPRMHGHEDRGALTWFTQGVPVFVDRGLYDKAKGPRRSWAQSAAAHSTFEPKGLRWSGRVRAASIDVGPNADGYVVTAKSGRTQMQRTITIPLTSDDSGLTLLRVDDVGTSRFDQQWYQRWHLSPEWTVLPRATASEPAAVHESTGLYLYGTCWTGAYGRGAARMVEHFPSWRTAVLAPVLECGSLGDDVRIDTVWAVSAVDGTFTYDRPSGRVTVTPTSP